MRKNGSRFISFKQYKFTDLFLFAVILIAFELILHYAFIAFDGDFTFSPMVPIVILVMMRWGWVSVFYAVGDGALFCLLNGGGWQSYLVYCVGNAFIMLVLILHKITGKEKISKMLSLTLLYVSLAWLATVLGRTAIAVCLGTNFIVAFTSQLFELISLIIGILIVLIMRRLDGMFEDQKRYLRRMDAERKESMRRDEYGDEPIEIDGDTLSILRKRDNELE